MRLIVKLSQLIKVVVVGAMLAACSANQLAAPQLPATVAQRPPQTPLVGRDETSHTHYRLVDLGTFGGPQSVVANGYTAILTNAGKVAGCADTQTSDPNYPNFNPLLPAPSQPDSYIFRAFAWQNGALRDLGALPGVNSSCETWISDNGEVVGASEDGSIDPLTGLPAILAVAWKGGRPVSLGTFGGNESIAFGVNDRGEVIGGAANTVSDPYSFLGWGTQTRAFVWRDGRMIDLGTLGGSDAFATQINNRGQIFGASYTSGTPNRYDAFIYEGHHMRDIPNGFGGSQTNPFAANNRGELVGQASYPDGNLHPFLWAHGVFKDLGGGDGEADWISDTGDIVGQIFPPNLFLAALWRHGKLYKLGTLPGDACSFALYVNLKRQIVGGSDNCTSLGRAVLWESGRIIDLNTRIPRGSPLALLSAVSINETGEIAGLGALPNGDLRTYLLIPCVGDEARTDDCRKPEATGAAPNVTRPLLRSFSGMHIRFGTYRSRLR